MSHVLWEALFTWRLAPTSLASAQAIVSHAAGENDPSDPGLVNRHLAAQVRNLYRQLQVPVIVQGELAPCLPDVPLAAVSARQAEAAPHYLTTFDITCWMRRECVQRSISRVVLVSYYPHYWRGVRAARRLGLTVLIPPGITELYDPHNSQWWARRKWTNRAYELFVARPFSVLQGWV